MIESLVLECDGEAAARAATQVMTRRGLYVVRSFDLRTAQAAQDNCACPDHGTTDCTCQYVVLLVYGASNAPAVLAIHGRDGHSSLQIVRDAYKRPEADLVEQIMAALLETVMGLYAAPTQLTQRPIEAK